MKNSPGLELNSLERRGRRHGSSNCDVLSIREREIMLLAAKGLANKEIARKLNVAEGTVKIHLHSVYQKLGIKSRFALAALDIQSHGGMKGV